MNLKSNTQRWVLDDRFLLKLVILALAAVQLLSYYGADWVIESSEWSTQVTATQFAKNNLAYIGVRYASLAIIFIIFLFTSRFSYSEVIQAFLFISICLVHAVLKFVDTGLIDSLYQSNVPLMYLLLLGFWIGKNRRLWDAVSEVIPVLLATYVAAFLITFVVFYIDYGWSIFQNSSLMNFYGHAFAMAIPFFYIRFRDNKVGLVTYLLLIFFLVGAVIIRSRAWLIQSVLLLLIVGVTAAGLRGKRTSNLLRFTLITALVVIGVIWLLSSYLGDFWDSIVEKGTVDSRSVQYIEMLEQTAWYEWILGKGADATYVSDLYGEYQFIDNEFFYLSFHYGMPFAILYFLPFLRTFFTCWCTGKKAKLAYFSALCILLWILSVNGMSVFHRIHLDVKSFIIPVFLGFVYTDMKTLRKEAE